MFTGEDGGAIEEMEEEPERKNKPSSQNVEVSSRTKEQQTCGDNYINADRFFLVLSPILFLIFNLFYWFTYGSQYILDAGEMTSG